MKKSASELLDKVLKSTTDEMYVQNPCEVVNVNGNFVDVLLRINDEDEDFVIYNVPIMRPETQRAYIFLGIKKGDRGVCRFFDRSVEGYLQSDFDYNSDERQHNINDRCFELGFIPNAEAYVYPTDKEIEIGLKNSNVKMSFTNDIIEIKKGNATIKMSDSSLTLSKQNTNIYISNTDILLNGNVTVWGDLNVLSDVIANYRTNTPIKLSKHIHTNTTIPTGNIE